MLNVSSFRNPPRVLLDSQQASPSSGGVEERRVVGGLERQDGEPCSGYVPLQGEWMRGGVSPPQAPLGFLRDNDISRCVLCDLFRSC